MDKKILIVEDDEVIQQLIEWRLKKLGYAVCGKATCAEEAFSRVLESEPDAILMDIHLNGGMDGIDAAAAIRKMNRLPIIFLTAESSNEELRRAKQVSPEGYILKPFKDVDLRVALNLALDNTVEEPLAATTSDDEADLTLTLDSPVLEPPTPP
jgi:CheY-like chemotaxis protein